MCKVSIMGNKCLENLKKKKLDAIYKIINTKSFIVQLTSLSIFNEDV